jgi:uncharacterized protein YqeY
VSAAVLKMRLRADLKAAMQSGVSAEIRVLRTLIAALDNAEAVPGEGIEDYALPRAFGDPRGEVARLVLDEATVDAVLSAEAEARLAAAEDYARHGREEDAARLRDEAAVISRYRA